MERLIADQAASKTFTTFVFTVGYELNLMGRWIKPRYVTYGVSSHRKIQP